MFMRMVVQGKIVPAMISAEEEEWTPELKKAHTKAVKEFENGKSVDLADVMNKR